jgi:hypothetical protein
LTINETEIDGKVRATPGRESKAGLAAKSETNGPSPMEAKPAEVLNSTGLVRNCWTRPMARQRLSSVSIAGSWTELRPNFLNVKPWTENHSSACFNRNSPRLKGVPMARQLAPGSPSTSELPYLTLTRSKPIQT